MKRALITGASGAIGAGVAAQLRDRGWEVVGIDVHPSEGVTACDVTDAAEVRRVVGELAAGGLDLLVNNAGIGDAQDAGVPPDERARRIMDVNFWGAWHVAAAALPALAERRGRVVNVASGLALVNVPFAAAYMASKRAVAAWSDALRLEYGARLGGVTTVYPGYIRTPIHDAAAARGISLEGAVPAEPLSAVVATIVRAGTARRAPRDVASTRRLGVGLRIARFAPGLVDRVVLAKSKEQLREGREALRAMS